MVEMYRQGDLLFIRADEVPKGARRRRSNVILEGEATGHSHRVENGGFLYEIPRWSWEQNEDGLFLDVVEPESNIIHEEHGTITLPKGVFQVVRQREFGKAENRYVMD